MTIFERIIAREVPAQIVHETADAIAFKDISPKAPTHVLIVPKKCIPRISDAQKGDCELLGRLLLTARDTAKKLGLEPSGYRLVINNGKDGGETVPHLHIHLLGGRGMGWPPG